MAAERLRRAGPVSLTSSVGSPVYELHAQAVENTRGRTTHALANANQNRGRSGGTPPEGGRQEAQGQAGYAVKTSLRVRTTAYIAIGVYSAIFLVYGISLPDNAARILGFLPTVSVLLFGAYDTHVWHWGPLLRVARQPYLVGTWHGELISYRRDVDGAPIKSSHEVYFVIRQTLTTISITMISAESKSRSAAAQVVQHQAEDFSIQYQYQNEPRLEFRQAGSSTHTGGSSIEIGGLRPATFTGEYWTARETRGTYRASRLGNGLINTFEEGRRLTQEMEER